MPKGYAIITSNVRDQTRLVEYIEAATPSVIEAGGNLIVAGAPSACWKASGTATEPRSSSSRPSRRHSTGMTAPSTSR